MKKQSVARGLVIGLAALATTVGVSFNESASAQNYSCKSSDYSCTTGGYSGAEPWGYYTTYGSRDTAGRLHNCTTYAAFKLAANGAAKPTWYDNAGRWWTHLPASQVNGTPAVGSIAEWDSGHVAYVEAVTSTGIEVTEDSFGINLTSRRTIPNGDAAWPNHFLHIKDIGSAPGVNVAQYRNTIVKWNGNATTSWYVTPDLKRLWIPDGGTYNELLNRGVTGPFVLDSAALNQMPDLNNQWVASGSSWTGNRSLRRGMSVRSADGRYIFAMQNDGNVVLYGPSGRAIWATSFVTVAYSAQDSIIFQADGNLVTYGGGRAIWATNTAGRGGSTFAIQSDGNLVVYAGSRVLWASNTSGRT